MRQNVHRAHYFGLYEFKLYKPYIFHVLYYYHERVCAKACRPAPVFFFCPRLITQFINEKYEVTPWYLFPFRYFDPGSPGILLISMRALLLSPAMEICASSTRIPRRSLSFFMPDMSSICRLLSNMSAGSLTSGPLSVSCAVIMIPIKNRQCRLHCRSTAPSFIPKRAFPLYSI